MPYSFSCIYHPYSVKETKAWEIEAIDEADGAYFTSTGVEIVFEATSAPNVVLLWGHFDNQKGLVVCNLDEVECKDALHTLRTKIEACRRPLQ